MKNPPKPVPSISSQTNPKRTPNPQFSSSQCPTRHGQFRFSLPSPYLTPAKQSKALILGMFWALTKGDYGYEAELGRPWWASYLATYLHQPFYSSLPEWTGQIKSELFICQSHGLSRKLKVSGSEGRNALGLLSFNLLAKDLLETKGTLFGRRFGDKR